MNKRHYHGRIASVRVVNPRLISKCAIWARNTSRLWWNGVWNCWFLYYIIDLSCQFRDRNVLAIVNVSFFDLRVCESLIAPSHCRCCRRRWCWGGWPQQQPARRWRRPCCRRSSAPRCTTAAPCRASSTIGERVSRCHSPSHMSYMNIELEYFENLFKAMCSPTGNMYE